MASTPYVPPSSELPARPDLAELRARAEELLDAVRAAEGPASDLLRRHHPAFTDRTAIARDELVLADAQLVLARHWGHPSWARLRQDAGWLAGDEEERARQFVILAAYNENGSADSAYRAAVRLLEAAPKIAGAGLYPALVLGRPDVVRRQIDRDPQWVQRPGGPFGIRQPLHYVTYSSFHRHDSEIASGLLEIARMLLDAGADPSASFAHEGHEDHPMSALYGACGVTGFRRMAELLLEYGADTDDGESLYHSLELDDLACFELLLACDVKTEGTNALNHSLDFVDATGTTRLLEHGADPNETNPFNNNPLDWAIRSGREVERLRLLVEYGADPRRPRERDGLTPFQVAVQTGHAEAASYLESIDAATTLDPFQRLILACTQNDPAGAQRLLESEPGLLTELTESRTDALLLLAERGRLQTLEHLHALGLPADLTNEKGVTALHFASWHGEANVVELLLERGAPLEAVEEEFGCTPLGWAAHGCDNWPNPVGDYPRVVRLLLRAGANPDAANTWGERPIDLACRNQEVVDMIWAAGGRPRGDD